MAAGDTGQTVLPLIAGVLIGLTWQVGLVFVVPLLVVVAIAVWRVLPPTVSSDTARTELSLQRARTVFRELYHPTLVVMAIILFLYIGVLQTFSAFYPTYLIHDKDFPQRQQAHCSVCFSRSASLPSRLLVLHTT